VFSRVLGGNKAAEPIALALEAALRARVARPLERAATRRARIVFDAGAAGIWTVDIDRGRISLWQGRAADVSAVITSDAATLIAILDGQLSGVEAFLDGRLVMRGNIALALELDDLLRPPERGPSADRFHRFHRVGVAGVRTAYIEAGPASAPAVVLLHGLGATSASFLPLQWDLSRDHHVFALDMPGFGESDKPVRALHPEYFARWLVAWLDAVGLERAHLVGNSMGGRVALEVGLTAPERVDRLVLLAPSLAWRRYRAAVSVVRLLRPELGALPIRVLHRLVVRVLRTMFAQPERVSAAAMNAASDEFIRVFSTPRGRIAFFHAAREIYLEDPHGQRGFWDRLPTLARPALFVFGEKDRLVPHGFLRHVRKALPNAEYEVFEGCGHVPQFELPERTGASVRAFLGRAAPRAG
jgi:pimeloyl-ACP methyl ester carboxylesterase/predicted lipid carrier protein YhbT